MNQQLQGKTIAILVNTGFEQIEMTSPRQHLEEAGAQTHIVSPQSDTVRGWQHTDWGDTFPVDVPLTEADPAQYSALMLPGGVLNADKLRTRPEAHTFVQAFFTSGKPVAAICHGPWTLIDAGVIQDRTITSSPAIKTDLQNAGAQWVDQEVVVDRGLVSSRRPPDLPAFNAAMVAEFAREHEPARQRTNAPNASFADSRGGAAVGYDSPPVESSRLSNEEYRRSPEEKR